MLHSRFSKGLLLEVTQICRINTMAGGTRKPGMRSIVTQTATFLPIGRVVGVPCPTCPNPWRLSVQSGISGASAGKCPQPVGSSGKRRTAQALSQPVSLTSLTSRAIFKRFWGFAYPRRPPRTQVTTFNSQFQRMKNTKNARSSTGYFYSQWIFRLKFFDDL